MSLLSCASIPTDTPVAGRICYDAFKAIAEQRGFPPDFPAPEGAIGRRLMEALLERARKTRISAARSALEGGPVLPPANVEP